MNAALHQLNQRAAQGPPPVAPPVASAPSGYTIVPRTNPSLAGYYIIGNFLLSYVLLSTRGLKNYYKIDHNVSPRQDLTKYGQAAVSKGKMTQKQLDLIYRAEGAHSNSVEHFPVFVGAMIFAHIAGLSTTEINNSALAYTVARVAFAAFYLLFSSPTLSYLRSLAWWTSNIICLRLFWIGTTALYRGLEI